MVATIMECHSSTAATIMECHSSTAANRKSPVPSSHPQWIGSMPFKTISRVQMTTHQFEFLALRIEVCDGCTGHNMATAP